VTYQNIHDCSTNIEEDARLEAKKLILGKTEIFCQGIACLSDSNGCTDSTTNVIIL
jgi:hypothetical protein